jgi:hypothetical protein
MNDHSTPLINVAARFRAARRRAIVGVVLLAAVAVVGAYVFSDIQTPLASAQGCVWLALLVSGGAVSLGLIIASWRCPACHRWLGFSTPGSSVPVGGTDWLQQATCPRCGAIFVDPPPSTGDEERDLKAQIEAVVAKDAKHYRSRAEVEVVWAISLILCGLLAVMLTLFLDPIGSDNGRVPVRAIGALMFVGGLFLTMYRIRRMRVGGKERERLLRLALEKRAKNQRRPTP